MRKTTDHLFPYDLSKVKERGVKSVMKGLRDRSLMFKLPPYRRNRGDERSERNDNKGRMDHANG